MSIIIRNVSTHSSPIGVHHYELYINERLIVGFAHQREEGLAKCLRRAADAVDRESKKKERVKL